MWRTTVQTRTHLLPLSLSPHPQLGGPGEEGAHPGVSLGVMPLVSWYKVQERLIIVGQLLIQLKATNKLN